MRWLAIGIWLMMAATGFAGDFHVNPRHAQARDDNPGTAAAPLRTLAEAARRARAGDTVHVHPGIYRESVRLRFSGTAESPIVFRAVEPGTAVVTGLDVVEDWSPIRPPHGGEGTPWRHRFSIGEDEAGNPVRHHPDDAPLWGRAEQVFADGVRLRPVATFEALRTFDSDDATALAPAVPHVGERFAGVYYVDDRARQLIVRLADGRATQARIEASIRELLFGVTPWDGDGEGVRHVQVSGFIFRGAAGFPQRPAVWLHGSNNLVENCIIESNAGAGVKVSGTLRGCLIRDNGHIGGSAIGDGFVNEHCVWIGNSWKPIDRGWEAGGAKPTHAAGGAFRDCAFLRNGGPGLWFDIDVRDAHVERCVFEGNELSGLFIEISRGITVENCLARGNGLHTDDWGVGGIAVAESMDVTLRHCELIGNRDGLAIREQGPRMVETPAGDRPFTVRNLTVSHTRAADNRQHAVAFWWDNPAFGPHPSPEADDGRPVLDPRQAGLTFDRNRWSAGSEGEGLWRWGPPWRPKSQTLDTLADVQALGFEQASPGRTDGEDGIEHDAGWRGRLADTRSWARGLLPAWIAERL